MQRFIQKGCALACAISAIFLSTVAPAAANSPRVAVLDFGMHGLTSDWWGTWQPGVALSDLVTDQLVNTNKFTVVDRQNLGAVLQEHSLSKSGLVSPATAVQEGRLIGARYMVMGNILQFDRTGGSNIAGGGALGGFGHLLGGGLSSSRITLRVQVRVIDVQTGQIVRSFSDEQTKKASSLSVGGIGGSSGASYSNGEFESSALGHLINDEASRVALALDPSKFQAQGPAPVAIRGHILGVDGGDIILNVGSRRSVQIGQYFDVMKTRTFKDPDTGRTLTSNSSIAKLQITQVSDDTSVATRISGSVHSGLTVESEP